MTNKINPVGGILPATQETHKRSTDASKVGKDVSTALHAALGAAAKNAHSKTAPGGGRLSGHSTTKKTKGTATASDHEEEEVFAHTIAPIGKGHDGHNDHQRHPEVPDHHLILPMADKKGAKATESSPEAPVAAPVKANPTAVSNEPNVFKQVLEKQTAFLILVAIKDALFSKTTSPYRKIFQVPSHFLGVVSKKLFDLGMFLPRLIYRPILKNVVRPALISLGKKMGLDLKLEALEFKKGITSLSLSYRGFLLVAQLVWLLPSALLCGAWALGSFIRNAYLAVVEKKGAQQAAPVELDDLAKVRAERQAQFAKDKAARETRLARQRKNHLKVQE